MALWKKARQPPPAEALFDATKIDVVAVSPDRAWVELVIVHDGEWTGSDAQVTSLQDKIHNYVEFALDGQMVAMYPDVAGLRWRIVIADLTGPPDATSAEVVARVGEAVRGHGGELEFRQH